MVGDLGKSLWLRQTFGSVYGENRPLCHIGLPTDFVSIFAAE